MAITVQMREQVSQLYVALFGRAPDGEGLGYWVGQLDAGKTMVDVANSMYATAPARTFYPSFLTNQEIIGNFYTNVLGRTADAEGLAFWTAKLNAAGATAGSVIAEMINVVANYSGTDPAGLTSKALFNNKVAVAQWYGEQNGNIAGANTVLTAVTSNPASVDAAKTGGAQSGQTYTLTTGIDNFAGTSGNDTFIGGNGAVNTYGPADQLDGGAGVDTVKLYGGVLGANIPTLKNIENVYVNAVTGGANVSGIAGVESLEVENINAAQTFTMGAAQSLKLTNINAATFITTVAGSAAGGITLNNVVDTTVTPNIAQTLDVQTRDAALKLTATGAASNINLTNALAGAATSLTTLNVEGDAGLRVNGNVAYTNLTTVDASKNTGGVNFVQGVDTNLTFTGGTGNDRVDVSIAAGAVSAQDSWTVAPVPIRSLSPQAV